MKTTKQLVKLAIAAVLCITVTTAAVAQKGKAATKLTDPEIASIAVTANQIDLDMGKLAAKKSKNKEVLNFAQTMQQDHQSVIDQAVALVKKLNVTPKDNKISQKLKADAARTAKKLKARSGAAFDKAYINNEVAYHKAVIKTVEDVLIAQASNEELKSLLQSVMPTLRTHLEHAQMVQKSLKG